MLEVYTLARAAAGTDLPVVICGQTGTGKELVARAIHVLSARRGGPFVDMNCAAIPETLAESELFGAEQGAFTGARYRTDGFLSMASGGTLLLDEVCSMPLATQAKLLRALEFGEFWRVGGRIRVRADFRIIATASAPLEQLIDVGRLRPDLAYRLHGYDVQLPRLCERPSDVPALVEAFLHESGGQKSITSDALQLLTRYRWPGNVRQLRHVVSRMAAAANGDDIGLANVAAALPRTRTGPIRSDDLPAVVAACGSVSAAARTLGVSRSTLRSRLKSLGTDPAHL